MLVYKPPLKDHNWEDDFHVLVALQEAVFFPKIENSALPPYECQINYSIVRENFRILSTN